MPGLACALRSKAERGGVKVGAAAFARCRGVGAVAREQVKVQALAGQPWRGRRRKAEASGGWGKRYKGG